MHARQATPEDAADMARIYNQGIADRTALESHIAAAARRLLETGLAHLCGKHG